MHSETPIIHNTVHSEKVMTHTHTQKKKHASCFLNCFFWGGKSLAFILASLGLVPVGTTLWKVVFIH